MLNRMRSLLPRFLGVGAVIRSIEKALCMAHSIVAAGYCRLNETRAHLSAFVKKIIVITAKTS